VPYLSASAVVFHYEEALYQVYAPLPLHRNGDNSFKKIPIAPPRSNPLLPVTAAPSKDFHQNLPTTFPVSY